MKATFPGIYGVDKTKGSSASFLINNLRLPSTSTMGSRDHAPGAGLTASS